MESPAEMITANAKIDDLNSYIKMNLMYDDTITLKERIRRAIGVAQVSGIKLEDAYVNVISNGERVITQKPKGNNAEYYKNLYNE